MLTNPSWLAEAARLPLAFALVREDALLDLDVLRSIKTTAPRVAMIASGGCTAAALARHVAHLHVIDANAAQLALTKLKLHLLQSTTLLERLQILGHLPLPSAERHTRLIKLLSELDLTEDSFGPIELVAEWGLDHSGRYERLFAQLRRRLGDDAQWEQLLLLADIDAQAKQMVPNTPLSQGMEAAYADVFSQANLVHLFGEDATRNRVEAFAQHFVRRTRLALTTLPAKTNPYLWSMLRGKFPANVHLPWLTQPVLAKMPSIEYSLGMMGRTLDGSADNYDFIHLSNILDWLSPDAARQTLDSAWRALRPGGVVFIRQLNSTLDITAQNTAFVWDKLQAAELLKRDRSFFYRALHLGRKP